MSGARKWQIIVGNFCRPLITKGMDSSLAIYSEKSHKYYELYTGNIPLLNAYYQVSKSNFVTCTNKFLLSVFAYALKWVDFNILDFLNESGICDDMLLLN